MYLAGTRRCIIPAVTQISTPREAVNSSQLNTKTQKREQWYYVSTIQASNPNYVYKYKSQTERLQSLIGRLSQNQCR